jgi:hypothetical protein
MEAGALNSQTILNPVHTPPDSAGDGILQFKADKDGQKTLLGKRKVVVYQDHLARDRANFGVGGNCAGPPDNPTWPVAAGQADQLPYKLEYNVIMDHSWNCHGSVWHMYCGNGTGWCDAAVGLPGTKQWEVNEGESLGNYQRGWIIAYYDKDDILMHSQMVLDSGDTTYGANNEPMQGTTESWKWAESRAGKWTENAAASYRPIKIHGRSP